MKKSARWIIGVLAVSAVVSVAGCQKKTVVETTKAETTAAVETGKLQEAEQEVRIFVDSVGREVEIPVEIKKIAPSGPLAQIVLYTVAPDQMAGLAADFSEDAKQYIDEAYWGLPKFGQFYGKNASLNMEALIGENPDLIIDIGEAKKTMKEDMDALQEQLGIPVVFIEATLPTMEQAYLALGDVTGEMEQAKKLAAYCKEKNEKADGIASGLAEDEKKTIYFALGDNGLYTNAKGSIHADIIEKIGAVNAADVEAVSSGGGSEVSFEQILLWQPDMIIADSKALYDTILNDKMWQELSAVSEGRVYKIPTAPYSFMSSPPSVNRMIGIEWLGGLVYPELYGEDIKEKVFEFYQLFYHIELTDEQFEEIMKDGWEF